MDYFALAAPFKGTVKVLFHFLITVVCNKLIFDSLGMITKVTCLHPSKKRVRKYLTLPQHRTVNLD